MTEDWDALADDETQWDLSKARRAERVSTDTTISLRLASELAERARQRAADLGVSTSAFIRQTLSEALNRDASGASSEYTFVVPVPYSTARDYVWTIDQSWVRVRTSPRTAESDVTGVTLRATA